MSVDRLARYVSIPSLSKEETALAACIEAELADVGLRLCRVGNNLWAEFGDAPRPRLLLNSHLDTVPPVAGWTGDPWTPRRQAGRLIGLGANDAKGCVVAMIEAALSLWSELRAGRRVGGTIVLALTAEEEISGAGLGTILDRVRPLDAALVGEPTGLTPMIAQRGLLIVRGRVTGRSAHPANTAPGAARNAIMSAIDVLARLREFDWGPTHPLLGPCHGHVTLINGGVARNVIPDACEFTLDIRTTPAETHASLIERLRGHLCCELIVHSDRLTPIDTPADEQIVVAAEAALSRMGRTGAAPAGSPAMSDMVFLRGVPAIKIGPGDTRRSHTADEFVFETELAAGAAAYEGIVRQYFAASQGMRERG